MDEQRLGELFREAVGEPPPAFFGTAEVVAASRRVTVRRRGVLAGGTLLGVGILVGFLLVSGVLNGGPGSTSIAGHAPPHADIHATTPGMPHTLGTAPSADAVTPRAGGPEAGQAGCLARDDALVAEVAAVLAERGSAVAGPAGEVPGPCPEGSRGAAIPVPGGTLYVLVIPQAGAPEQADVWWPDGRREHAVMLDGGGALVVISMPAVPGQPTPLGEDLSELAEAIASRL